MAQAGLVLPEDTVLNPALAYERRSGLPIYKSPIIDSQTYNPILGRWLLKRSVPEEFVDSSIGKQPQIVSDRYEIIQNYEMVGL